MKNNAKVVIIGGGISGVAIAYNLAKMGETDVIVLEKDHLASGATGRCGAGIRQQWGTKMNCLMAKKSIEFFETAKEELDYDGDLQFKQKGYLLVSSTKEEDKEFEQNVILQNKIGIPARKITKKEALKIVPHLNPDAFYGAAFCPTDGHLNPFTTTDAFYKAAKRMGITFYTQTEVLDIKTKNKKITEVITTNGSIKTETVVNAAGGHSYNIGQMVGLDLPVYSENHEILVTEAVEQMQGPMVISFSQNFYCQQTPHGSFIMGRGEPDKKPGLNVESTHLFLDRMSKTITKILPKIGELRLVRQWGGLYNISPDHQPIYGPVKEVKGFYLAIGFSGHGFMFAPVTGMIIAEMILKKPFSIDISGLTIDRFEKGNITIEGNVV
ncbi:MAG: FAD-binding oxidoreductase [Candidatus Izimaplasma sp.]|nr:FAD-binding oxidoreductase [Candidatus Izimaplasma bacterium]